MGKSDPASTNHVVVLILLSKPRIALLTWQLQLIDHESTVKRTCPLHTDEHLNNIHDIQVANEASCRIAVRTAGAVFPALLCFLEKARITLLLGLSKTLCLCPW